MPNTSRPVSVCVSKCSRPTGPRLAAIAAMHGSVTEWSPPSDHRQSTCVDDLADDSLDRGLRRARIGRYDRRVAVVDDAQRGERVDACFEVRAGRARGAPDRARREARAGPVGDEVVGRRADDRDVDARELLRLLRERQARRTTGSLRSPACRAAAASVSGGRACQRARSPPTTVPITSRSAAATAAASSGSCPSTQPVSTSSSAP